jgi:AcrR family transcriptional regulator
MNTESKDEIIKAEVLKSAAELFQQWGLNKTTMEDIAKRAGKGKSTLYYYFKSKEEIFEAVVMKEAADISRITLEAVEKSRTAGEKLQAYAQVGFSEVKKRANLYDIVRKEIREMNVLLKSIRGRIDTLDINMVQKILVFGIRNGEFMLFNEEELRLLSSMIVSSFRSIQMELLLEEKYYDQKIRIDFMTSILVKGLSK